MTSSILTVDLGNSRCKLCLWTIADDAPPALRASHELDSRSGIAGGALAWLAAQGRVDSVAVSSVASPLVEDELCAALELHVEGRVLRRPDPGLAIACREPETVGRDRLFAARGACEVLGASAIVVDAGTALTVDALQVGVAGGAFLGGAIAPGPKLLAEALVRGTSRLKLIEPRPGAAALGRDTEEALQSGVVVGFRGAARALVEGVSLAAGLGAAPVVLTGGARRFLTHPAAFEDRLVREVPDLVHRGLIAACTPPQRRS